MEPALLQPRRDVCGTAVEGVGRLSPLIGCDKDCSVPGHCFRPFFPSPLHWPQCLPPALGRWPCHPHASWRRDEEEQPGNTEAGRRPAKEQARRAQGPGWAPHGGGGTHRGQEHPRRREDSQPPSRTSSQPSASFTISLQCYYLPPRLY